MFKTFNCCLQFIWKTKLYGPISKAIVIITSGEHCGTFSSLRSQMAGNREWSDSFLPPWR